MIFLTSNLDNDRINTEILFSTAFKLKLGRNKESINVVKSSLITIPLKALYRPKLQTPSTIVNYNYFEYIWDWLPSIYRL